MARIQIDDQFIDVPDDATPEELDDIAQAHAGAPKAAPAPSSSLDDPFSVSRRTDTQNVPADQGDLALRQIGASGRRVTAAALPVVAPIAASMALSPAAGFAARTAMAGLGGAAGEAGRQLTNAVGGEIEKSPKEAAEKIGVAGAVNAAGNVAGEALVGTARLGAAAVRNVGRTFLDFLANVRRGTAKTAGKLAKGAIEPATVESVQKFGQDVSNAVKARKSEIGGRIEDALQKADAARPEGVVPIQEVRAQIRALRKSLGTSDPIPGAPETVTGATKKVSGMTAKWIRHARRAADAAEAELSQTVQPQVDYAAQADPSFAGAAAPAVSAKANLSLAETKRLIDRIDDAISEGGFNATDPGAVQAAKRRLAPLAKWLRGRISEKAPLASQALKEYGKLIDDSDAVDAILKIRGGETITPERITQIEQALPKFLRSGEISDKVLSDIMDRLGKPELASKGKGLAVANELTKESAADGGGGFMGLVSRSVRGVASPVVRPMFEPASRALNATRVNPALQKPAGLMGAVLARKKEANRGRK